MTSSLVGSEMCIRDSKGQVGALSAATSRAILRVGKQPPRTPTPASTPVSYTHLTLPTICSV
eukprot:3564373-Prorocentrum_lima.AAC.1